jgi:hypothetical protein
MCRVVIVAAENERMYGVLCKLFEKEPLVVVLYDRRAPIPWPWPGAERRMRPEVDEQVRAGGFALVRPTQDERQNGYPLVG